MKSIVLLIITILLGQAAYASNPTPNVTGFGKLYQYNRKTEQFDIDLGTPCKVTAKNFVPHQGFIYFDFQIFGLPRTLDRYSIGSLRGNVIPDHTFNAKLTVIGKSETLVVKTAFYFYGTPEKVLEKPRVFSVAITNYNAIQGAFTGDPITWGYLCEIASNSFE